jgi:hypothetical protein
MSRKQAVALALVVALTPWRLFSIPPEKRRALRMQLGFG